MSSKDGTPKSDEIDLSHYLLQPELQAVLWLGRHREAVTMSLEAAAMMDRLLERLMTLSKDIEELRAHYVEMVNLSRKAAHEYARAIVERQDSYNDF